MESTQAISPKVLSPGLLRRVHHIALNVVNLENYRYFYGTILLILHRNVLIKL